MDISIDITWILSVLLVSVRVGWFFFNTPFDALGYLPTQVKLAMVLGLSAALVTGFSITLAYRPDTVLDLVLMVLGELLIGLTMVAGLYCVFAALGVAGRLIDFQTGFGAAGLFNPATNNQEPLVGMVLTLAGSMWFFLSGMHHYVIKAIGLSLQQLQPGTRLIELPLEAVVSMFGVMLSFGFVIAAPVLAVLYLLDTAIAVMAKTMPQMNVYFLFIPLKIFVSLLMTGLLIRFLEPVLNLAFKQIEEYWLVILF